jgi:exodeoxyribonuclease V alpha subunit
MVYLHDHSLAQHSIRLLDKHTGLFLEKLTGTDENPEVRLAGMLASAAIGCGHVCQPLDQVDKKLFTKEYSFVPETKKWRTSLLRTEIVGKPGDTAPLILDRKNRLYLYRFYHYECSVGKDLLDRAQHLLAVDTARAKPLLTDLFTGNVSDQQLAAVLALLKRFVVISGGPGTGKTYTMARTLALVQGVAPHPLRIVLAAPTGKAAARMEEAIRRAKTTLPPQLAAEIPETASTLHRLLGYQPEKDDFRYNARQQLDLDMLVIDEASMIDLPMMYALLQALPQTAQLILLGDRHQLASVEAGSLFSDICQHSDSPWSDQLSEQIKKLTGINDLTGTSQAKPLADCVVLLKTSYRFSDTSGIGSLAAAVNSGSWLQVATILSTKFSDLQVKDGMAQSSNSWLHSWIIKGFVPIFQASTVEDGFAAMEQFRFLCAMRKGSTGVEGINSLVEKVLLKERLIPRLTAIYPGKPIIIRRNNYAMQLFNGDTGLLWNDSEGNLKAWFKRPDNSLYPVPPARLPEHDTAYAITIHKSQGSEFEKVLLLMPEKDNSILSRELLYTGITRARKELILCADRQILKTAVNRQTVRYSGLAEKLWEEIQ